MAETVDFYLNDPEMPLVKTIELPNGRGRRFFFACGGGDCIALLWSPNAPEAVPGIASMHPDYRIKGSMTAHASMNCLAITVPLETFDAYAERLRAKGLSLNNLAHDDGEKHLSPAVSELTWIRSMDFRDPNGLHRELAALTRLYRPEDVVHAPMNSRGGPSALDRHAPAAS